MDATDHDFDTAGHVVRARRLGDLSQRDLAEKVGLVQSGIVDIEGGRRQVSVPLFVRMLKAADHRLCVVDADGVEVGPVAPDIVRDNAGRRFPAHLDLTHPDQLPPERIRSPRYDREPAKAWYHLRDTRDRLRENAGPEVLGDHPTPAELRERRRARMDEVRRQTRARSAERRATTGVLDPVCDCETGCWGGTTCVPDCGCQCEPA